VDAFLFGEIFDPSSPVITLSYREGQGFADGWFSHGCDLDIQAPLGTTATGVGALLVFGG